MTLVLIAVLASFASYSQTKCSACNGYGKFTCNVCTGYGQVITTLWDPYYGYYCAPTTCSRCNGYGYLLCSNCEGKGYISKKKKSLNFGSGCNSYNGNKCSDYKSNGFRCDCSGFDGKNWEPCICRKCEHRADKHTR